ncbi:hypothetical protein GGS20DRAFT_484007 [Poronia punctata]|nr:hypothetical protein GGS20DRAFT_484007 [Poronia punctata]
MTTCSRMKTAMKAFLTKLHHHHRSSSSSPSPGFVGTAVGGGAEGHDVFARLPFELHLLILAHLGPSDIEAALGASRVLRLIWLSEEMWPALADRWFPGLSQYIRLSVGYGTGSNQTELFRRSLHRMSRRTDGKFAAAMHYGFGLAPDDFFHLCKSVPVAEGGVHSYETVRDLEIDDEQRFSRFMMFSNGRIAWWPEGYSMPYLAVVDDLRTRLRRVFLFPSRDPSLQGYQTAMGGKLFIMGHGTKLHVWHLELNRLESFEVPQPFKRCVTENETVLVVTHNSDVYIWNFGQGLRYIDMHKLPCYPREYIIIGGPPVWTPRIWLSAQQGLHLRNSQLLIDFILSPTDSNIFFVITLALETGKLTVYEIHDGAVVATFVMDGRYYSDPKTSERGLLRWEKLNSYGGYCLVQVIQEQDTPNTPCPCGRDSRLLVSLCFNIYTKTFKALRHHLGHLSPWVSHVWNDRLSIMDMDNRFHARRDDGGYGFIRKTPVLSLAPCAQQQQAPIPVPVTVPPIYTTIHQDENTPLIHRRRRVLLPPIETISKQNLDIRHGLDVLQEYSPDPKWREPFIPKPSEINPGKLVGDDEFFVYVNAPSYTVLSFGEDFPVPVPVSVQEGGGRGGEGSGSSSSRSWWRKPKAK